MPTAETWGSHGVITFDTNTGIVIALSTNPCEVPRGCDPEDTSYKDIVWIDVEEWKAHYPNETLNNIDILDVGYRTKDGHYTPPEEDWRQTYRTEGL